MRTLSPPLSVTLPPPSMTILGPVSLTIFAVCVSVMVTGSAPQSNVITPPFATALTNASPVQLSLVPVPTTVFGFDASSALASTGTSHFPSGFPAGGPSAGLIGGPVSTDAESPVAPVSLELPVSPLVIGPVVPLPSLPPQAAAKPARINTGNGRVQASVRMSSSEPRREDTAPAAIALPAWG